MLKVRLFTSKNDGFGNMIPSGFVADIKMTPFVIYPKGILWGERFFAYYGEDKGSNCLVYIEDLLWYAASVPGNFRSDCE